MGKVIRFPSNSPSDDKPEIDPYMEVEQVLRGVLAAIRHGTIRPDKVFIVFEQGDVVSYLNAKYEPDQMVHAMDLVLQDIARGYDSD